MTLIVVLILLFPLLGFLVLGLGFRNIPAKVTSILGPGTILISFILSILTFFNFTISPSHHFTISLFHHLTTSPVHELFSWISVGDLQIPFGLLIDPLSILMLLIVTGVGFIIHVYSIGYMKNDPGYNRFFAYMNLFVFSMLLLVMGSNYPVMFIGWEGVGLCSYLLIGFWFKNHEYNNAAKKAFIMNRIGDLGFLLGMFLLFTTFHSLNFQEIFAGAKSMEPGNVTLMAITLLLFVGAVGKSAQIPLYTWLPDAMAGPTPVSALIHAATMVTAGVYMVARSNILYALSPTTMAIMGITGLATTLFAASIAIFQNDIKKILAYSTISQLGYMFLALSVGAFTGAMFHLTTHAFFKALLFLAAGSMIHALGGEQDIRKMGGLSKKLPISRLTFLAGVLAIAGIPPLSGFFSKDEILLKSFEFGHFIWFIAVIGSLMTAFYMFRLFYLTFSKDFRGTEDQKHHLHESPAVMTIPLITLAVLSILGGLLNIPAIFGGNSSLEAFLSPVFTDAGAILEHQTPLTPSTGWILMGITLAGVLVMILWAYQRYVKQDKGLLPDEASRSVIITLISKKYFVDEIYNLIVVKPVLWISQFLHRFVELRFIDRMVDGVGQIVVRTGNTLRFIQTGNVGFYMFIMVLGIILILFFNILI
ncbi:MAG: NADH-quinone oxidoreductase subunit L [Bacteroidales bacterium]|jgi:NADH-quinone oxidoreductase subunit L|nr:NADH-quinone oxidoreductase subunit L [Bacteroidales bacterium]